MILYNCYSLLIRLRDRVRKAKLYRLFGLKKSLFIPFFLVFVPVWSAQTLVLDWSGSYQVELNTLQKGDFAEWGQTEFWHNLHLKPDIKAFDNVRVHSWFLFSSPAVSSVSTDSGSASTPGSAPTPAKKTSFASQEGLPFGLESLRSSFLTVKSLYMEVAHDFGRFQWGWKPHHFGLGMYYNDSSKLFSPVYNLQGSRGFVSWRGFIGSSYYVSPFIHYIGENRVDIFIQGGWKGESYGIELIYKTQSFGEENPEQQDIPSYLGFYAYYEASLTVRLEGGYTSDSVYGGALDLSWQTPLSRLKMGLKSGLSTSQDKKSFHFDPSFSSGLSFLMEEYEHMKQPTPNYLEAYKTYSFHSAIYIIPSVSFSFSDSLKLKGALSTHVAYSDFSVLLYHSELSLEYQMEEGLTWNTGLSVLFPQEEHWHIGALSQVAIAF